MLDPQTYRASEHLAKSVVPHWRIAQTHNLDHFERVGFPVRITSVRELGQVIDTMQENRFSAYMAELGGLTAQEYGTILGACCDAVRFQLTYLPHRRPVVPVSTLLSGFMLYKKMLGANPGFRSVLEIGPGCGYASFFLRHHKPLQNYSQIEACESFYILQNLVNVHCFGPRFDERALSPESAPLADFFFSTTSRELELPPTINLDSWQSRCTHYPWWRIGEMVSRDIRFEIVMSNANLLEFNPTALEDYLSLIDRVLEPNGIFLVQCTGWPAHGNEEQLLDKMRAKRFAPLMFMVGHTPARFPGDDGGRLIDRFTGDGADTVTFPVNNAVFVKSGHPLFERYFEPKNFHMRFIASEPIIRSMFFERPAERRLYTIEKFLEDCEAAFRV